MISKIPRPSKVRNKCQHKFQKNFSTVGSFFTCRWQIYSSPYARNNIGSTRRCLSHTLALARAVTANSGEIAKMFPKKRSRLQAPPCIWINIILLVSDPQLSQKSLLWRVFFVAEWIYSTTMSAPHNTET